VGRAKGIADMKPVLAAERGNKPYPSNRQTHDRQKERLSDTSLTRNIGQGQRLLSVLAGLGFIIRGLTRPSAFGVILGMTGISLVYRGACGYCPAFAAMGIATNGDDPQTNRLGPGKVNSGRATSIRGTIVINRPPAELYRFWRSFDNLPRVMSHLQSVFVINDRLSYWVGQTLVGGPTVEWDAEIVNDIENERIDWRSLADADLDHTGSVELTPNVDGQSTKLTLTLHYALPAGLLGVAVAEIFGEDPENKLAQDLQRFKERMEEDT
jgi:uncharacterized membrane protein